MKEISLFLSHYSDKKWEYFSHKYCMYIIIILIIFLKVLNILI